MREIPPTSDRDALRQALRDLQAAEARVARDAQRVHDETRAKLIADLFPVLDNLDRTLRASGTADGPIVQGVKMVRDQLEQVLARYGVERFEAVGEMFDPKAHHAVATIPVDPSKRGLVVEEIEAGYRFGDRVLRPAKVAVGAA